MKFLATLLFSLLVIPVCSGQRTQRIRRLDNTTITTAEAGSFASKTLAQNHVTGAQLAIINDGKLVWSYAYGLRHKNPDLPMTPDTNTWAASLTKSVFATYVMSLLERGEFDLDTPIAMQLPHPLDNYEPYRVTASEIIKDPRWISVTPRMLLSHTSGLANFAFVEPDKKMRLRFDPGTSFLYSGEGINLVQFVIEQQKHTPIDELMQSALFTPLGMTQTGMVYRHEFDANLSDRFNLHGEFHSVTHRFPARAAGNMASSVNDLARFATALLNGKIIKPQTMQKILSPQIFIRFKHQFQFGPDALTESAEGPAVGLAYGIGWGLLTHTKFGPAFFKEGHGDGAQNYIICFERTRSCMILLTNDDNGELAFRPLLEHILGDTVTPWEWEGYTPAYIESSRRQP